MIIVEGPPLPKEFLAARPWWKPYWGVAFTNPPTLHMPGATEEQLQDVMNWAKSFDARAHVADLDYELKFDWTDLWPPQI